MGTGASSLHMKRQLGTHPRSQDSKTDIYVENTRNSKSKSTGLEPSIQGWKARQYTQQTEIGYIESSTNSTSHENGISVSSNARLSCVRLKDCGVL